MREQLAAALHLDISDTPQEPVENVAADVQAEAETAQGTQTLEAIEAPSHWAAEQRERFVTMPRETQEWLLSRDKEMTESYTRKTTELADLRKAAEEVTSVLEPYKQQMELAGVSPSQAIQRLLAAQKFLETNPSEGIKWLAQQYQVDLSGYVKKDEAYIDPDVKALRDELTSLKSQLGQRQQAEQNQIISAGQKQILDFKAATNADGTVKYPHFDKLEEMMVSLVRQGKTLAEAYETAQYTLPETRERIASEAAKAAQAETLKKAEDARKQKAKDVKGAGQVIRSRGTAAEDVPANKRTLRQELAANLAESSGRI